MTNHELILDAALRITRYLESLPERRVAPSAEAVAALEGLQFPLQDEPQDPAQVLEELDELGSPATVASAGGRFFGFVIGGSLPAALAANLLAGAWDQNASLQVMSPAAAAFEETARRWLADLFGLPPETGAGFVTGATMANFTGLAAARHALLARQGWQVEDQGLFGAPEISVVVGGEVHVSVLKALSLLGLGRQRVTRVPVDGQGRMRPDRLPDLSPRTILCLQAGNVNTGAFDPAAEIIPQAQAAGAWVHVDGAFGLWAAACPRRAHLMRGYEHADSWATDVHKWLNAPYDSGLALVRDAENLRAAMSATAAYLEPGASREPMHYTPEMSRRARGVEVWAALRSLGRRGLAEMIEHNCQQAGRFAHLLRQGGLQVLNEVELNQVLVSFGSAERTREAIRRLQEGGEAWAGVTVWQGHTAMRISVSSWATSEADVERSAAAMLRIAESLS